jgi:hypothetical protein
MPNWPAGPILGATYNGTRDETELLQARLVLARRSGSGSVVLGSVRGKLRSVTV